MSPFDHFQLHTLQPRHPAIEPQVHADRFNTACGVMAAMIVIPLLAVCLYAYATRPVSPAGTPVSAPQHIIHSHPTTELRPALGKDSR